MTKLRWLWLLVPVLGLLELAGHAVSATRAPDEQGWERAAARVRALKTRDDLVVIAPYWEEPNARQLFGDVEMPLRDVARPDASGYERAIELSLFGKRELPGWKTLTEETVGAFTLRVLKNPRFRPVLYDFVDELGPETAKVFSERRGGAPKSCPYNAKAKVSNGALHGHPTFPRARFECGGGDWHFVGVTVIEDEHYRPRRCLWAHPSSGSTTVVKWKGVTLGAAIRGYGGISYFVDREGGKPVDLEVRVDGETIGTHRHKPKGGFQGFEFSTSRFSGKAHDVEFRVSAKNNRRREFCFQADVR